MLKEQWRKQRQKNSPVVPPFRQTEVDGGDLHPGAEEDVGGVELAQHDTLGVQVAHAQSHALQDLHARVQRHLLALHVDVLEERLARQEAGRGSL